MQWPNTLEEYGLRLSEDGRALSGFSPQVSNSCAYSASSSARTTDRTQRNAQYYDGFYKNKKVSLKVYLKSDLDAEQLEEVKQEVIVHSQLQHDYIIDIHHIFEDDRKIVMVLERASGVASQMPLQTEEQVRTQFHHLLRALLYIHSLRFLHRNLLLESIFYVNGVLKIGNFNKACRFQDPQDVVESPRRKFTGCPQEDLMSLGRAAYMLMTGLSLPSDGPLAPSISKRCAQWIETTRWTTCEESVRHPFFLLACVPRIVYNEKPTRSRSCELNAKLRRPFSQQVPASVREVSTTAEGLSTIVSSFGSRATASTPSRAMFASPLRESMSIHTPSRNKWATPTTAPGSGGSSRRISPVPPDVPCTQPMFSRSSSSQHDPFTPTLQDVRYVPEHERGPQVRSASLGACTPRIPVYREERPWEAETPSAQREARGWSPHAYSMRTEARRYSTQTPSVRHEPQGCSYTPSVRRQETLGWLTARNAIGTPRTPTSAVRASSSGAPPARKSWHVADTGTGWRGGSLGAQFDRALDAAAPKEDLDGIVGFIGSDVCEAESSPSASLDPQNADQSSLCDYLPPASADGRVCYASPVTRSGSRKSSATDWRAHHMPTPSSTSDAQPRAPSRFSTSNPHTIVGLQNPPTDRYLSSLAHPWSDSSMTQSNAAGEASTSVEFCHNNATAQFGAAADSSFLTSESESPQMGSPIVMGGAEAPPARNENSRVSDAEHHSYARRQPPDVADASAVLGARAHSLPRRYSGDFRVAEEPMGEDHEWNETGNSAVSSVAEFHRVVRNDHGFGMTDRPRKHNVGVADARRVKPIRIQTQGPLLEVTQSKQIVLSFHETSTMVIEPGGVRCTVDDQRYTYKDLPESWAEWYKFAREIINTLRAHTPRVVCKLDDITGELMDFPSPAGDFYATFHSGAVTKGIIRQHTALLTSKTLTEISIPLDMAETSLANIGWEFGDVSACLASLKNCYQRCIQKEKMVMAESRSCLGRLRVTALGSLYEEYAELTKRAWPVVIDERTRLPS